MRILQLVTGEPHTGLGALRRGAGLRLSQEACEGAQESHLFRNELHGRAEPPAAHAGLACKVRRGSGCDGGGGGD
jgi:hypothetical protein